MSTQLTGQPRAQGEKVAHSDAFEWLARIGLAARGVVYAVIALLAIKLALGDGGKATDQEGALKTIAQQPFGKGLLIVLSVGIFGYALWRLLRAALGHGPEAGKDDTKERLDGLASGIGYALLLATAIGILLGSGGSSSGPGKAAGGVLDWPLGQWLVALAGIVVVGVAAQQGYKAVAQTFLEKSKTEEMGPRTKQAFTGVGVFGHLARMVIFALIGYFLIKAALDYDPDEAVGLDGALAKLANASYGPWLLGLVAFGLLGFALYSAMDARYRRV